MDPRMDLNGRNGSHSSEMDLSKVIYYGKPTTFRERKYVRLMSMFARHRVRENSVFSFHMVAFLAIVMSGGHINVQEDIHSRVIFFYVL
jgi:hypothetical protein